MAYARRFTPRRRFTAAYRINRFKRTYARKPVRRYGRFRTSYAFSSRRKLFTKTYNAKNRMILLREPPGKITKYVEDRVPDELDEYMKNLEKMADEVAKEVKQKTESAKPVWVSNKRPFSATYAGQTLDAMLANQTAGMPTDD